MEVIETVVKGSQTMKDVNALIQTMQLEKFKFVNNKYIEQQRSIYKKGMHNKLKKKNAIYKSTFENKSKYLHKLILYNSKSTNDVQNSKKNLDLLVCNPDWPVCLYDHCYKNRCISYFAFRCGSDIKIIDDYFEPDSFMFTEKRPRAKSSIIDIKSFDSSSPREEIKGKKYNSLLIERNPHYCKNKEFVKKIKKLLEDDKSEWAFEDSCILSEINDEMSLINSMENYMNFIMDIDNIDELGGEMKQEDEISLLPIIPIESNSTDIESNRRNKFQLRKYMSKLTPIKSCENFNMELKKL